MLVHPCKNTKNVGKMLNPVGEQPNNAFNARRTASQHRHELHRSAFRGLSEQLTDRRDARLQHAAGSARASDL